MKKRFLGLAFAGVLAIQLQPLRGAPASGDEVDLVVSSANKVNALSLDDARKIFKGDKRVWPEGSHITVLMLPHGRPERMAVLRGIYNMSETDYSRYFLEAIFTGRLAAPPKEVGSPVQMKQFLAANPGAIGYLDKADVDGTVRIVLKLM